MTETAPDFIVTHTGRVIDPANPRVEDIDIIDVAYSLSQIIRYTGHCAGLYSVAQHSVLCAQLLEGTPFEFPALMHDAHEMICGDVSGPLKRKPGMEGFRKIEDRAALVVAEKFGLPWPMPREVHAADMRLWATEKRDLMPDVGPRWTTDWEPLEDEIVVWHPTFARRMFLQTFYALRGPAEEPQVDEDEGALQVASTEPEGAQNAT